MKINDRHNVIVYHHDFYRVTWIGNGLPTMKWSFLAVKPYMNNLALIGIYTFNTAVTAVSKIQNSAPLVWNDA